MAIVKMHRFVLTLFSEDKPPVLNRLMRLADVHFSDLTKEQLPADDLLRPVNRPKELAQINEQIEHTIAAIKLLEEHVPMLKGLAGFHTALPELSYDEFETKASGLKLKPVYHSLRQIRRDNKSDNEAILALKNQNKALAHYRKLDVPFAELKTLKRVQVRYGFLPKRWKQSFDSDTRDFSHTYKEELFFEDEHVYLLLMTDCTATEELAELEEVLRRSAFTEESFSYEQTPVELMAENTVKIQALETAINERNRQLADFAEKHLASFQLQYEDLQNKKLRYTSNEQFLRTDRLTLIEGYVPFDKKEALQSEVTTACKKPFDLSLEAVERNDERVDDVPVLLRNNSLIQPFESIVETFSVPRYDEVDPTPIMMPWYSLSFGMMIGDLGYGIVMFLLTTLALKFIRVKKETRSFLKMFQILSIPTMLSGVAFGSFFSVSFPGLIAPTEQYMEILSVSVVIGFLMLFFGLGVQGYMYLRDGKPLAVLYDVISWYSLLIGAILLLAGPGLGLPVTVKNIGLGLVILGSALIIFFSARDEKSFGGRLGWGAYNLYGVSSWVGDLVSFTRIAALVLSGSFIGYAVNMISGTVMNSGVIGVIGAVIILVVFHAFNIFLSGLSAYVHSMRLVYVEFFGKFFTGGGVAFKRFRPENKYIDVK